MFTIARWLGFLAVAMIAVLAASSPAGAQVNDPHGAGGPNGHGTKLSAHDAVVITAPVTPMTIPNDPSGSAVCYSINNDTDHSYFLPWNTPKEYTSFLIAIGGPYQLATTFGVTPVPTDNRWIHNVSIYSCCQPQAVGQICTDQNGNPITSTAQLGYRYEGTLAGDIANYGAQNDVYGPIYASVVSGKSSVDYRVTFACSKGNWVKTHEEGSCVPVAGQCGEGSAGITSLPADPATLCTPTSVFGGFTNSGGASNPAGPWTWTCLGTPGSANASCSSAAVVDGACGTAANQFWPWFGAQGITPASTGAQLCANGTTPSAVSPVVQNIWNNPGTTYNIPNQYNWTCTGIGGSAVTASCKAYDAEGLCGINGTAGTAPPAPAADFLCATGTPSAIGYGANAAGFAGWMWTCSNRLSGPSYYNGNCIVYDSSAPQPGQCGALNNEVYTSDTVPPPGNLCGNSGVIGSKFPSVLTSGPVFVPGTPSYWAWTCQGPNNGTTVGCSAGYDPFPAVCGAAANKVDPYDVAPASGLCSVGVPDTVWSNGGYWIWNCLSATGTKAKCVDWGVYRNGQCGGAEGVATVVTPTALCALGTATPATNSGSTWEWQCLGSGSGASSASCSAPVSGTASGSCGVANGAATANAPTMGLCAAGSATAVVDSGAGQWVWTCASSAGSASCSATNTGSGPGVCGAANATSIPDQPNFNLCASGAVGPVAGTGPWSWQCIGEGPNLGQNASCSANVCRACAGSVSLGYSVPLTPGTVSPSGCPAQGQASWLETDALSSSNSSVTLQWNDPFYGTFNHVANPASAPAGYCPPCYLGMQSVTSAQVTVVATPGSCPADPALNAGSPVTYPASNVTVH